MSWGDDVNRKQNYKHIMCELLCTSFILHCTGVESSFAFGWIKLHVWMSGWGKEMLANYSAPTAVWCKKELDSVCQEFAPTRPPAAPRRPWHGHMASCDGGVTYLCYFLFSRLLDLPSRVAVICTGIPSRVRLGLINLNLIIAC